MAFNNGKPYYGSEAVTNGKLTGATGRSHYFFFICPKCEGREILRVLDFEFRKPAPPIERPEEKKKPKQYFNLAFQIYCPKCQFMDFVKLDNNHQAGPLTEGPL